MIVFAWSTVLCFRAQHKDLELKTYCKLGQISGLPIVNSARGPECLHFCIVDAMYGKECDVISIDDNEDFNDMLDINMVPSGDAEKVNSYLVHIMP